MHNYYNKNASLFNTQSSHEPQVVQGHCGVRLTLNAGILSIIHKDFTEPLTHRTDEKSKQLRQELCCQITTAIYGRTRTKITKYFSDRCLLLHRSHL